MWSGTRSSGVLTDASVLELYERLGADPSFDPSYRQLCDLRAVERLETTPDTLRYLAQTSIFDRGSRRAFVVGRELAGASVEGFRDYAAAATWLGVVVTDPEPAGPPA